MCIDVVLPEDMGLSLGTAKALPTDLRRLTNHTIALIGVLAFLDAPIDGPTPPTVTATWEHHALAHRLIQPSLQRVMKTASSEVVEFVEKLKSHFLEKPQYDGEEQQIPVDAIEFDRKEAGAICGESSTTTIRRLDVAVECELLRDARPDDFGSRKKYIYGFPKKGNTKSQFPSNNIVAGGVDSAGNMTELDLSADDNEACVLPQALAKTGEVVTQSTDVGADFSPGATGNQTETPNKPADWD